MTQTEALKLALEALKRITHRFDLEYVTEDATKAITAAEEALAQPEQEPVAMKFKIYKPTVPDPMRQGINNALLPWVYDQDRSSGFDASMWVTPVATLPPQRKPLTREQRIQIVKDNTVQGYHGDYFDAWGIIDDVEAAHGIKE